MALQNENIIGNDLHDAAKLSAMALTQVYLAASQRLQLDDLSEVRRRLADRSGRLALFISSDGDQVHLELALIDADTATVFTAAMLVLDAPMAAAIAPAGAAQVVDRSAMS